MKLGCLGTGAASKARDGANSANSVDNSFRPTQRNHGRQQLRDLSWSFVRRPLLLQRFLFIDLAVNQNVGPSPGVLGAPISVVSLACVAQNRVSLRE